jgi:surface protein
MGLMFFGATNFNQPLNAWNVSNVTNMSYMFYGALEFNQPLDAWRLEKDKQPNMKNMFSETFHNKRPIIIDNEEGFKTVFNKNARIKDYSNSYKITKNEDIGNTIHEYLTKRKTGGKTKRRKTKRRKTKKRSYKK